jgi:uncharacterized repeat protein (TIGR01451 family)
MPNSGVQESTADVTFAGTNFVAGMTVDTGLQLSISNVNVLSPTSATATLTIPASAAASGHGIRVRTPSGLSGPVTFTVLPGVPTLTEIIPPFGIRGYRNEIRLNGRNFASPLTLSPIPGVAASNVLELGSFIRVSLLVDENAPLGTHPLSVTTPGGTTNELAFAIVDPFPDLSLAVAPLHDFYAGLDGTYSVLVLNNGTAPATGPIVVTDLLPPEFTFVSGGGNGFQCSPAGQLVTCSYSGPPAGTLSFDVTVAVSADAPNSLSHVVAVPHAADLLPGNNSRSIEVPIRQVPAPLISFQPISAGQQALLDVRLPNTLPHDVTGTLTLKFSSAGSPAIEDQAIAFASGGREVSFTIPANTLVARFGNATSAGAIAFQTGTTAGAISFDGVMRVGSVERAFTSPVTNSLTIAATAPVINNIRTSTQGGFAALITSYSTPRSITQLTLQFVTTPSPQLSCGSVPGCTASGATMVFDVGPLFDNWFANSSQFGSLTTLRVPLSIQGFIRGSVNVILRNSLGESNSVSFALP